MDHFTAMIVLSAAISLVFAILAKDDTRERIKYFLLSFAAFFLASLILAWGMYPFPFR